jgi:hypothetical protein
MSAKGLKTLDLVQPNQVQTATDEKNTVWSSFFDQFFRGFCPKSRHDFYDP